MAKATSTALVITPPDIRGSAAGVPQPAWGCGGTVGQSGRTGTGRSKITHQEGSPDPW